MANSKHEFIISGNILSWLSGSGFTFCTQQSCLHKVVIVTDIPGLLSLENMVTLMFSDNIFDCVINLVYRQCLGMFTWFLSRNFNVRIQCHCKK